MSAAVCFGVPHATLGEEVEAAVTLSEPTSEADLLAYCRERLAEFKRPKKIHIVTDIPRTATVTARSDSLLYSLERDAFLLAVSAHPRSTEAAHGVASARIGNGHAP